MSCKLRRLQAPLKAAAIYIGESQRRLATLILPPRADTDNQRDKAEQLGLNAPQWLAPRERPHRVR
jgi:hypothetical protein